MLKIFHSPERKTENKELKIYSNLLFSMVRTSSYVVLINEVTPSPHEIATPLTIKSLHRE